MPSPTPMPTPHYAHLLLSDEEIDILNAARRILKRAEENLSRTGNAPDGTSVNAIYFAGRVAQSAEDAERAMFEFLNSAKHYTDVPIPNERMRVNATTDTIGG